MNPISSLCRAIVVLGMVAGLGAQNRPDSSGKGRARLEKEVRHELVMLPFYDLFDNLEYKVTGGTVTLIGQVTQPNLKSDAEKAVRQVEGVDRVDNRIEVLPLSPSDDHIRVAVLPGHLRNPRTGSLRHASRTQHPHRRQERSCVLGGCDGN